MVPADAREVGVPGGYMQDLPPSEWKQSDLGHYPLHWVSHLMHAYEVVGYRHPDQTKRLSAFRIYRTLTEGLHLPMESQYTMIERLSEDRIANGTVIS